MTKPTVSPEFLLQGALFALENSGNFLRSGVRLYESGEHAPAIVMAMFGREELGKYIILRDYYEQTVAGHGVTLQRVRKKCSNHQAKQRRSVLGIGLGACERDRDLAGPIRAICQNPPGSKAHDRAHKLLEKRSAQRRAQAPIERHHLRLAVQYVSPIADGTSWRRPCKETDEAAKHELWAAVNDYSSAYDHLVLGNSVSSAFRRAFQAWVDRPAIAAPVWPGQTRVGG